MILDFDHFCNTGEAKYTIKHLRQVFDIIGKTRGTKNLCKKYNLRTVVKVLVE
jgi:hypothetical protein